MSDIIIYQEYGGLGDNLQFSTLPELFAAQGHTVYISHRNVLRNPEIHELVWEYNPFVSGVSEQSPNCGSIHSYRPLRPSIVTSWEMLYGFGAVNNYPKIYYSPLRNNQHEGQVFVDLNNTSLDYDPEPTKRILNELIAREYPDREVFLVRFEQTVSKHEMVVDLPTRPVSTIFEYCDLIQSCHALITLTSGGSVLASAIRQSNPFPIIHELKHIKNLYYIFDNVSYINV